MEKKILNHFKISDPVIFVAACKVIKKQGKFKKLKAIGPENYFAELCEAIINQQLSDKVAAVIFARFKKLFPKGKITPKSVLKIPDEKIRAIGSSYSKIRFIKDLAQKIQTGELKLETLTSLDNEKVVEELIKVKGIGPWTAEMFLMFSLGREDIFSHGDLGLRRAIQKLYKLKKEPTEKQTGKISKKWSPYRTYACMILWKSLDF